MIFLTFGFWLVWMAVRKRKEKVVEEVHEVCQDCGNDWKIGYQVESETVGEIRLGFVGESENNS